MLSRLPPFNCRLALWFLCASLFANTGCEQRPVDLAPTGVVVEWERLHTFQPTAGAHVVWASGPADIYVGYDGIPEGWGSALLHYNGADWIAIELPLGERGYFRDLWGSGEGDVYLSGESLWRKDGNTWSLMPVPPGVLAGTGSNDVYVGSGEYVTHFNGASWDTILTTTKFVRSIYAFPGPELVVARNDSILHWNGSTWSREWAVGLINDMWGRAPTDLYAVGSDRFDLTNGAAAWHWNGATWTSQSVPPGLQWIDAVSGYGNDLIAVAGYSDAVLRFESDAWNELRLPTARSFSDVAFTGPGEWVAVGEQDRVSRWRGAAFTNLRDGGPNSAGVAWMDSRDFVVLAEDENSYEGRNAIYRFEAGVWHEDFLEFGSATAMDGSSRDNVFMTTWGREIIRYDGSNWSIAMDSLRATQEDVSVAPDGGVFTVGGAWSYRFDGATWESTYSGGGSLRQVWAQSRDEAYAIDYGAFMRFAGGSWRVLHEDAEAHYQAVWGTGDGEVYVGSLDGIYRYTNGSFQRVSPAWDAEAISGTSRADIIATNQWFYFVFDGVLWIPGEQTLSGYGSRLDVSGDGNDLFLLQRHSSHFAESDDLLVRLP